MANRIYTITPAMLVEAGLSPKSALAAFTLRGTPDPADEGRTFQNSLLPTLRADGDGNETQRRFALDGAIRVRSVKKG